MHAPGPFHNAIVYVDESGDHGPVSAQYPVFVLAFCMFDKPHYAAEVTTAVQQLKFRYFGHDAVVLHEREIRKAKRPYSFLLNAEVRTGKREDGELRQAFQGLRGDLPCDLVLAPKTRAHAGMEIADLVARPIGRHVLNPGQPNRAWDVLAHKFLRNDRGEFEGWGLKVFS